MNCKYNSYLDDAKLGSGVSVANDNITRSYFYVTLREQCKATVKWLETLPIECFLSLIGLSP
jgi:hypothetical protein